MKDKLEIRRVANGYTVWHFIPDEIYSKGGYKDETLVFTSLRKLYEWLANDKFRGYEEPRPYNGD